VSAATGFGALDWAVLAGYFIGITSFGLWLSRKTRTSGGYFLGERKLPWWVMIGQTYGAMTKRVCTIGWALTGLIAATLVFQRGAKLPDAEHAFGYASRELLGPGWVGLMVACVLAANMSACSNLMVNSGALFTRNIWLNYGNPAANDRQLLWAGRLSGLV